MGASVLHGASGPGRAGQVFYSVRIKGLRGELHDAELRSECDAGKSQVFHVLDTPTGEFEHPINVMSG